MDAAIPPPNPTGKPPQDLTLTGMLMPWCGDRPALVHMHGVGEGVFYLPLFDEEDKLRTVLARANVPFKSIKLVEDGFEFLDSIPPDIVVITNLRFTDEGRIRFMQVQR
jgi:hypothetical protein